MDAATITQSIAGDVEPTVEIRETLPAQPAPLTLSKAALAQIILIVLGTIAFFYFARPVLLPILLACVAGIRRDFFRFVRADSSAVVKRKFGVAGDSFFEITRGQGKPLSENDASIVCNEQFQNPLEAAVDEVRGEAMRVLKKVNNGLDTWTTLGTNLMTTRERLDQLVGRVDDITANVQSGNGTVGKLLTDSATADELKALLDKANHSADELQVTLNNFQQASTNLPAISDAVRLEANDIPGLVLQTKTSMRELERLAEAMQRTWILRKYVNPTNPPPAHPIAVAPEKKPVKTLRSPRDSEN